jgi:hypothetical protein
MLQKRQQLMDIGARICLIPASSIPGRASDGGGIISIAHVPQFPVNREEQAAAYIKYVL